MLKFFFLLLYMDVCVRARACLFISNLPATQLAVDNYNS